MLTLCMLGGFFMVLISLNLFEKFLQEYHLCQTMLIEIRPNRPDLGTIKLFVKVISRRCWQPGW